jgi:hypothetical protein
MDLLLELGLASIELAVADVLLLLLFLSLAAAATASAHKLHQVDAHAMSIQILVPVAVSHHPNACGAIILSPNFP